MATRQEAVQVMSCPKSGNVFVVSNRANVLKNNATSAELRRVADWIDKCEI